MDEASMVYMVLMFGGEFEVLQVENAGSSLSNTYQVYQT
jgi:hypothetical protein